MHICICVSCTSHSHTTYFIHSFDRHVEYGSLFTILKRHCLVNFFITLIKKLALLQTSGTKLQTSDVHNSSTSHHMHESLPATHHSVTTFEPPVNGDVATFPEFHPEGFSTETAGQTSMFLHVSIFLCSQHIRCCQCQIVQYIWMANACNCVRMVGLLHCLMLVHVRIWVLLSHATYQHLLMWIT